MTIRIVTDSTCDLPADIVTRYGIHIIPLYINVGNQGYLDQIDITRNEFYTRLPYFHPHPTTAVPSIERFFAAYTALVDEGADEILSIHIATALSAVSDVARVAAKDITTANVTVVDSGQLSMGTGFMVETAARMASQGNSLQEILAALSDQASRTHVFAVLDTLEYLKRSGRMNKYVAGVAGLLQIKPILTMHNGEPGSERVRTKKRALKRLVQMLEATSPIERVAIVHTHASDEAIAELRSLASHLLPSGSIIVEDITPVIGAHIGPGAVGFAVIQARNG